MDNVHNAPRFEEKKSPEDSDSSVSDKKWKSMLLQFTLSYSFRSKCWHEFISKAIYYCSTAAHLSQSFKSSLIRGSRK